MSALPPTVSLPLFPLQTVLFPGGLLALKVFEARYLDLMGRCLRERSGFGVVALQQGREVRAGTEGEVKLAPAGVVAELIDVDSPQSGILQVRCRGTHRFHLHGSTQQSDGLWIGEISHEADDPTAPTPPELQASAEGLARAVASLQQQGTTVPFLEPYHYDDAGWVANRWCELLPIPLTARQKLMELDDPVIRLRLVDDFLRQRGIID